MSCCVALLGHELLPIPYWTEQCHGLYACHLCGNIPIGYTRHVTWLAPSIVVLRIPWEQEYKDLSGSSCINSYTSEYALICAAVSGLNCSEYICFRLSVCLFLILVVSLQLESNHSTNGWFEMGNLQLLIYQKPIFPRPITRISIDTWTLFWSLLNVVMMMKVSLPSKLSQFIPKLRIRDVTVKRNPNDEGGRPAMRGIHAKIFIVSSARRKNENWWAAFVL